MNEWKALVGRISIFPAAPQPSASLSALHLYRMLWGTDPENFNTPANPLMATNAQGKRNALTVGCSSQPLRIDFNLTALPPVSEEGADTSLALIEDASQLHTELMRIIEAVDQGTVSEKVSRVAINVHFIELKPNAIEVNKTLTKVIPKNYGIKITDEEDFIFQVNRARMSSVDQIKMNYIIKWSMDRIQVLNMAFPVGGAPISGPLGLTPPQFRSEFMAASVLFDNNNVPESNMTARQQSSLLREGFAAIGQQQREFGLNVEGF